MKQMRAENIKQFYFKNILYKCAIVKKEIKQLLSANHLIIKCYSVAASGRFF